MKIIFCSWLLLGVSAKLFAEGPVYHFNFYQNYGEDGKAGPTQANSQGAIVPPSSGANAEGTRPASVPSTAMAPAKNEALSQDEIPAAMPVGEKKRLLYVGSLNASFVVPDAYTQYEHTLNGLSLGLTYAHGEIWSSGIELAALIDQRENDPTPLLSKIMQHHALGLRYHNYWKVFQSRAFGPKEAHARLELSPMLSLKYLLSGINDRITGHHFSAEAGADFALAFNWGKAFFNYTAGRGKRDSGYGITSSALLGLGLAI